MALYISDIRLDGDMKETILYENPLMNHSYYIVEYDTYFQSEVPWHWHDEMEILSITKGRAVYKTSRQEYILRQGDAIFLNTGVLHMLRPLEPNTVSCAHLFERTFLSGAAGNWLDIKYLTPVVAQRQVEAIPFYRDGAQEAAVLEKLDRANALCEQEGEFFEIRLQHTLLEIWEWIFAQVQKQKPRQGKTASAVNEAAIKKILLYIQEHYDEDLRVSQLARLINVSERECYRLFQNYMDTSPMAFLLAYRIRRAQSFLIGTDKSIMEIAMDTGFKTSSYFAKVFKQAVGMTPVEFRHHWAARSQAEQPAADP